MTSFIVLDMVLVAHFYEQSSHSVGFIPLSNCGLAYYAATIILLILNVHYDFTAMVDFHPPYQQHFVQLLNISMIQTYKIVHMMSFQIIIIDIQCRLKFDCNMILCTAPITCAIKHFFLMKTMPNDKIYFVCLQILH